MGSSAVRDGGLPHLTPTLSAPKGGEEDIPAACLAVRSMHALAAGGVKKRSRFFETTAGQVTDILERLGVPKERMVTLMIENDRAGRLAHQSPSGVAPPGDRRGPSDDDIDRLITRAQEKVEPRAG